MTALRNLIKALDSAWRAGRKQFRHMRTLQRNAARIETPFSGAAK